MSRVLDLPSLRPGERVQDTFLVLDAEQKSFEGGACTVLTFGNASGRLASAPFWDREQAMIEGVRRGHVVQVLGEVAEYRGRRQLRVSSLRLLPPASVELGRLMPTVGDVSRLWETVDAWRAEIRAPRLASVVALFYEDARLSPPLRAVPGQRLGAPRHAGRPAATHGGGGGHRPHDRPGRRC